MPREWRGVVWIESDPMDVGAPGAEGEEADQEEPAGGDAHVDTVRVEEFSTNTVSAWIEPGAIQFDHSRSLSLPISQVPWLAEDVRLVLDGHGAATIAKEFPGYGPGDTLGLDYRQVPARMPDKSGYFLITFPSVLDAARCATALNTVPGIGVASLLDAPPVQAIPNDEYFDSFPVREPYCTEGMPGCARNPEWHLYNPYPGRLSSFDSCGTAVTGMGVNLPGAWPVEYPQAYGQTVLGWIDTGVAEDHPDLKPWPIPQAWRSILLNHPSHDWCGPHGTAMAGLAAARANNDGIGIAGLCGNCYVLDMESADTSRCSPAWCTAHSDAWCRHIGQWDGKVPFVADNMGPELASLCLSMAGGAGAEAAEAQVVALWHAYRSGILCAAPSSDQYATTSMRIAPADVPFVLGIGGFTHDGRYWDYNTTCGHGTNMSTPGPGIDICFPASPSFVTTMGETISQPPYEDRYFWTSGMCSGAAAMATAAIGLFREMWLLKQESSEWCQYIPPDDIAGILEATAQPWDPSPLAYSVCGPGSCLESDFGKGRVDLDEAIRLWDFLYCEEAGLYFTHHCCVRWDDPGVQIDSTNYVIGDTLVREYEVSRVVPIPLSHLYLEGVPTPRLAWIIRDQGWPPMEQPTSLLAYGDTTQLAGKRERFRLAAVHGITDGHLSAVNQSSGLATVTGHNFARVYRDGQGQEQIQYVVPPAQFKIVYAVITVDDMAQVQVPDTPDIGPTFTHVPSPGARTMRVAYRLPHGGRASVHLYDVGGRERAMLVDAEQEAGEHWLDLAGSLGDGRRVARGVYWLVLRLDQSRDVRRLVIVD